MDLENICVSELLNYSVVPMDEMVDFDAILFNELTSQGALPSTIPEDDGDFPSCIVDFDVTHSEIMDLSGIAVDEILHMKEAPETMERQSTEHSSMESQNLDGIIDEIWNSYLKSKEEASSGTHQICVQEGQKRKRGHDYTNAHNPSLEKAFQMNKYPSEVEIFKISEFLGLSRKQVALWFSKRRAHERQQADEVVHQEAIQPQISEHIDWDAVLNEFNS